MAAAGGSNSAASGIVYSLVSRGATVFAEHTSKSGNFQQVTRTILEKFVASQDGKHSYSYDEYLFHIVLESGLIFLAMTSVDLEKRVAFAFLDDVRDAFLAKHSEALQTAVAYEMNKSFAPFLQEKMEFYSKDPKADKLRHLKGEVEEVKNVMVENIERILDRGDKIELLVDKAEDLSEQIEYNFRLHVTHSPLLSQFKLKALICGGVSAVVIFIIVTGTNCFGQC